MPVTTPHIKIAAVEARGAKVVLHGDSYSDALRAGAARCRSASRRDVRASLRRPGRDRRAGHDRHGDPAPVRRRRSTRSSSPIGGGGLIGGHRRLREARAARDQDHRRASRSTRTRWRARSRPAGASSSPHVGPVRRRRGGEAGRQGDVPPRARSYVDEMILRRHRRDLRRDQGRVRGHALDPRAGRRARDRRREGVGRAAPASQDRTLVAIACGANMNFDRLRFVAERAELGEAREAILAVTIPERPGSFREFCALLGKRNVTEFNYRYRGPADRRTCSSASRCANRARDRRAARAICSATGIEALDLVRQRDGEAARPPPGRRPRAARRRERDPLPLRVSRAARRADAASSTA